VERARREYTYAVLGTLVGLVVLVLFFIRREEREYLWFALLLLANAIDIGLNISRVLALIPLPISDFIDSSVESAALFAALAFFSVVLRARVPEPGGSSPPCCSSVRQRFFFTFSISAPWESAACLPRWLCSLPPSGFS
jgi:hypothetical protein